MTWREIGLDSYKAAQVLRREERWRSSVSRSYYAAYSIVAGELEGKATYPHGMQNPPHVALPELIRSHVTSLGMNDRRRVGSIVSRLFEYRVDADYRPRRTVDEETAVGSLGLAADVLRMFGAL